MENKVKTSSSSIVIRQFMEFARGEVPVHAPKNEFQTVSVTDEEFYCLKCFTKGLWDVWEGLHDGLRFRLGRCRACGCERTL
jgi:hypothetical protein